MDSVQCWILSSDGFCPVLDSVQCWILLSLLFATLHIIIIIIMVWLQHGMAATPVQVELVLRTRLKLGPGLEWKL